MYIGIKEVKYLKDYKLLVIFENMEQKIFDVSPHLDKGIFKELRDIKLFKTVHISFDTIEWENGADLDPEIVYEEGEKIAQSFI